MPPPTPRLSCPEQCREKGNLSGGYAIDKRWQHTVCGVDGRMGAEEARPITPHTVPESTAHSRQEIDRNLHLTLEST